MTVYNLGTNYASATYNFVPNGAAVTQVHDIIETASCNACHDQLSAHGGSPARYGSMCACCAATPQNNDPNTGLTLDAKVFFHKLHMGASLPSVVAGTPYVPAWSTPSEVSIIRLWSFLPIRATRGGAKCVIRANDKGCAGDRVYDQSDARGVRVVP